MSVTAAIPQSVVLQTADGKTLLTWDIVPGATSYDVQRSVDGVIFVTTGSPVVNSYLDSAVTQGVNYYYQVASVNGTGTSSYAPSYPTNITPCLPGQMNLGYIRYLSQLRADMLNSEFLTMDEWNSNINQSAFELYDILVSKFGDDYFMAPYYVFLTTGVDSYALPDGSATYQTQSNTTAPAVYKLLGVDCGLSTTANAWTVLPRFNWIDRTKFIYPQLQANQLGVFGLSYRQMGNRLVFIPTPSAGQYIRVSYVPMMTQMLRDVDMLDFSVSGWVEYVIVDAAIKALLKEESYEQAGALSQRKAALLERIETQAANRDLGQPNTISDTRDATSFYGNGGFSGNGSGSAGW